MWKLIFAFVLVFISMPLVSLPQSPEPGAPRALIEKALKAGGGVEKIAKFKGLTLMANAKMPSLGEGTVDGAFRGPEQVRLILEAKEGGRKGVIVFNGRRGWIKEGAEEVVELPREAVSSIKDLMHAVCLPDLLMTLKGKEYSLRPLKTDEVQDMKVHGIRVNHSSYKEVRLFFDKSSGLVTKSMVKLNSKQGKEEWCECFFSDYKEFEGVRHFTRLRVLQGGEEVMRFDIRKINLVEKLASDVFEMPK